MDEQDNTTNVSITSLRVIRGSSVLLQSVKHLGEWGYSLWWTVLKLKNSIDRNYIKIKNSVDTISSLSKPPSNFTYATNDVYIC